MSKRFSSLKKTLSSNGLEIVGAFRPNIDTQELEEVETMLMIGPKEPIFWEIFKKSKEYIDGKSNPLDRWSKRILKAIAKKQKSKAYFPFDKDKNWPFYSWALECEEINSSPVKLLVHNEKGLFISFRGALGLSYKIDSATNAKSVCMDCSRPCEKSCPVDALNSEGYDVKRCIDYISTSSGKDCLSGCLVRRSCPYGSSLQPPDQSAFHMNSFLKTDLMA